MSQTANRVTTPAIERGRLTWSGVSLSLHAVLIYLFLYLPILVLIIFSFTRDAFGVRWARLHPRLVCTPLQ